MFLWYIPGSVIVFFETIRYAYGHSELLPVDVLRKLSEAGSMIAEDYVEAIKEVAAKNEGEWRTEHPRERHYPMGVIPEEILGQVVHTTCTGETTLRMSMEGVVTIERHHKPFQKHWAASLWEAAANDDLAMFTSILEQAVTRPYWSPDEFDSFWERVGLLQGFPSITIKDVGEEQKELEVDGEDPRLEALLSHRFTRGERCMIGV